MMESQSREPLLSFSSQTQPGQRWAVNLDEVVEKILEVEVAENHGVVQQQTSKSMEVYLFVDKGMCKGGRVAIVRPSVEGSEKFMVAVSNECAFAGGGTAAGLGIFASNTANAYAVQIEPYRVLFRAKDDGEATDFHLSHGKQAHHKANSSLSAKCGVQSTCVLPGNLDGSTST